MEYQIVKTYFRGNPKYGRTTTLLRGDKEVYSVMGVVSKKALVTQYERSRALVDIAV